MSFKKLLFIAIIIALVGSVFVFDLTQYLTLEHLKQQQQTLNQLFNERPFSC